MVRLPLAGFVVGVDGLTLQFFGCFPPALTQMVGQSVVMMPAVLLACLSVEARGLLYR